MKNSIKVRILDYLGGVYFVHVLTISTLTPWLIFLAGMPIPVWQNWLWQATLIAPLFNAMIVYSTLWFVPKWRKRIGYK